MKGYTVRQPKTDFFVKLCKERCGIEPVKEYQFHPLRKWRFDYCFPELRIAIEIDGGVWTGGRHTSPKGYYNDMEKFNEAAALGYVVLKFTPDDRYALNTFELINETIKYQQGIYVV